MQTQGQGVKKHENKGKKGRKQNQKKKEDRQCNRKLKTSQDQRSEATEAENMMKDQEVQAREEAGMRRHIK